MFGLSLKHVLPQAPCSLILNLYESLGKRNPYVSHSFTLTSSKYSLKGSLDVLNSWNHIFLPSLGCCLSGGQHLKERKYVRPFGVWWGPQLRLLLPLGHYEESSKCGLCFHHCIAICQTKPQCPAIGTRPISLKKMKDSKPRVQHVARHLLFSLTQSFSLQQGQLQCFISYF